MIRVVSQDSLSGKEENAENESVVPQATMASIMRLGRVYGKASVSGLAAQVSMKALGIDPEHVLYANSTCPDEINRTEDWSLLLGKPHFNLGGLGGLVAVGRSGLKACASHASFDSEAAGIFVFVASHLGINADGMLGQVRRPCQKNCNSHACGAAVHALQSVLEDTDSNDDDDNDDYQMNQCCRIVRRAFASCPYEYDDQHIILAESMYRAAVDKLCRLIPSTLATRLPVILLGGIQVNTDHGLPDFFLPRHFLRFDVSTPSAAITKVPQQTENCKEYYQDHTALFSNTLMALSAFSSS